MANYARTLKVLEQNYELVPLEIFGSDPYKTLISTLLSARTKDEVTLEAAKRLFARAPNIIKLSKLSTSAVEKLIYPVGFYKTKAVHLKKLAELLLEEYGDQVPQTREELTNLPGVGRKTANLVLNRAFGIPAIAVDTHVHKICNYLGWVNTKTPEETEKALNSTLPKKYWSDINRLMVSLGRKYKTKKRIIEFLEANNLLSADN